MIKKIKISFEYGGWPLWLYDEKDILLSAGLPEELKSDYNIEAMFNDLQDRYNRYFIRDNEDFQSEKPFFYSLEEKEKFIKDFEFAKAELMKKLKDKYEIEDKESDSLPLYSYKK